MRQDHRKVSGRSAGANPGRSTREPYLLREPGHTQSVRCRGHTNALQGQRLHPAQKVHAVRWSKSGGVQWGQLQPGFFVPTSPYQDYIDEAIYFTSQASIVNSFKTIMDDMWTDTTSFGNYANLTGTQPRKYPTFQIDPELNFPPSADGSQDYYTRTATNINQETQKIDIIMYRITNDRFTAVTNAAVQRGVPVRLITEQDEYRNRDRPWDSYNVDLMYNAGVQIRIRGHQGLNHQKTVVLYGLGMSIFGSSNWTGPSSNCQQENNYFTNKPSFLTFFSNQFDRKWNSAETALVGGSPCRRSRAWEVCIPRTPHVTPTGDGMGSGFTSRIRRRRCFRCSPVGGR